MKGKILVTGGAGYIGSFIVRDLKEGGFKPVIVDDMSSGHEEAVSGFELHEINIVKEPEKLDKLFAGNEFQGVIHMAGFIQMGESYEKPGMYFRNNVVGSLNLLEAMAKHGVSNFVFSSSAGVYGEPENLPIKEDDPKSPANPYGETKLMVERMLPWFDKAHGLKFMSIRYFNAAGAALNGEIGSDAPNESHLIPRALAAAVKGEEFTLFGGDYHTVDGTCVRDYIHVLDLADTHILALKALMNGAKSNFYNVGQGKGYSNKQVVEMIKEVTGLDFKVKIGPRRAGDTAALVASIDKIKTDFGWEPKYGLKEIIESAYLWHKNHPEGYKK
ncbi:UDP-glucose 4-epimerase GalE [Candidatus Woesebacteria bacterium]|nr:UDP-glucose 4-epimerase GalE [Candidatus Woesebacteria bacterium]